MDDWRETKRKENGGDYKKSWAEGKGTHEEVLVSRKGEEDERACIKAHCITEGGARESTFWEICFFSHFLGERWVRRQISLPYLCVEIRGNSKCDCVPRIVELLNITQTTKRGAKKKVQTCWFYTLVFVQIKQTRYGTLIRERLLPSEPSKPPIQFPR